MSKNNKVIAMYNKDSPFPGLYQLILSEKNYIKRKFFEFFLKRKLNKQNFIKNIIDNNFYKYLAKRDDRLRVLDLGCGTGENTVAFAQYFFNSKIVGIDASKSSIMFAKKLKKQN